MKKLVIPIILIFTFVLAFFLTTIFSDAFDWHVGYYNEGLEDSRSYNG